MPLSKIAVRLQRARRPSLFMLIEKAGLIASGLEWSFDSRLDVTSDASNI